MSDLRVSPELFKQSLKSCDEQLIKFIIKHVTEELIPEYISELEINNLPNFIKSFNKFIIQDHDYLSNVLPWIECLIKIHQNSISASGECRKYLYELQLTLKKRIQNVGLFINAHSMSRFINNENKGKVIGLNIITDETQILNEDDESVEED